MSRIIMRSSGFSLIDSSVSNILEDNTADRNGFGGFDLRRSPSNTLFDNIAKKNHVLGFYFENSSLNAVRQKHACANQER